MTNIIEVDFAGAPPAQGGGTDHIPRGQYTLKVTGASLVQARSGRNMVRVSLSVDGGPQNGARERDQFVIPGVGDKKFGLQRFNAFLEAVGYNIGEKKVKIDLDKLMNRRVLADIVDDLYEPENGAPKTVSRMDAYYRVKTGETAAAAAPATPITNGMASAPIAAAAAEIDDDEIDDDEIDEDEAEETPVPAATAAPAARKRSAAPATTPTAEQLDEAADDADDLFS